VDLFSWTCGSFGLEYTHAAETLKLIVNQSGLNVYDRNGAFLSAIGQKYSWFEQRHNESGRITGDDIMEFMKFFKQFHYNNINIEQAAQNLKDAAIIIAEREVHVSTRP
jgi:hypothetical protein